MLVQLNFGRAATGWNIRETTANPSDVIFSDLLDSTGTVSGISLTSIASAHLSLGSRAAGDFNGWPDVVWDSLANDNGAVVQLRLAGLSAYSGQSYIVKAAAYGNDTNVTDITVGASTLTYTSAATTPPAPLEFTGTIGSDTLDLTFDGNGGYAYVNGFTIELTAAPSGPTLTGPATVTEGTPTSTVGTGQDTVTTLSIQTTDAAFSVEQTKGVATETGIPFTPASGINACSIGVPAAGIPLVPTVSAAGITAYATELKEV